jgi:DNA-binding response OmpR family regulator
MPKFIAGDVDSCADRARQTIAKILVVDDEPVVGDALKVVLESNGYEVVVVQNGREGISQASSGRFCIAIVDLFLSDMLGLQAIKRIREQQPKFPIILITGMGTAQAFSEARQLGVVGILTKPFHPSDILRLVTREIDR